MVCRGGWAEVARGTALLWLALSAGWLLSRVHAGAWQLLCALMAAIVLAVLGTKWRNASAVRAAQRERARLSAELHDGVSTQLASLTWSLSSLRRAQAKPSSRGEDIAHELATLEDAARDAQAELRRVVLDLRTPQRSLQAWSVRLELR